MNNELTNVYDILKRECKETMKHFRLEDNNELGAFLHYNAHNELFIGTENHFGQRINFKNFDTGKWSIVYDIGSIFFLPEKNHAITAGNYMNAFMINDRGTKSIKVNDNGLFVETNDLRGNIMTKYYDSAALA